MCPDKQKGFGLPMAIFIITVMALLVAAMLSVSEKSAQASSANVLSMRAFYAAESGMNIALNRLFPPQGSAAACSTTLLDNMAFTAAAMSQCRVSVSCVQTAGQYYLRSSGQCGSAGDLATRIVEVVAK